jgi:hypothetical protein
MVETTKDGCSMYDNAKLTGARSASEFNELLCV